MKTIDVPESLTQAQYVSLIESVGLDPKLLRSLEFRVDGIYAEVMERSALGGFRIDLANDELVVNRVFIPIKEVDDDAAGDASSR